MNPAQAPLVSAKSSVSLPPCQCSLKDGAAELILASTSTRVFVLACDRSFVTSGRIMGSLLSLLLVGPLAAFAGGESRLDLRADYQRQQVEGPTRAAKLRAERMAQCQNAIAEFMGYDRYKSPLGWRVYGVDLRGRVWLMAQGADGSCALTKYARLERPDYSIEPDGIRQWRTFYYENKQLCLYTRAGQSGSVRKVCHTLIGDVPKFAPYFLH